MATNASCYVTQKHDALQPYTALEPPTPLPQTLMRSGRVGLQDRNDSTGHTCNNTRSRQITGRQGSARIDGWAENTDAVRWRTGRVEK